MLSHLVCTRHRRPHAKCRARAQPVAVGYALPTAQRINSSPSRGLASVGLPSANAGACIAHQPKGLAGPTAACLAGAEQNGGLQQHHGRRPLPPNPHPAAAAPTAAATTLSALHFLASAASLWLQALITGTHHPKLPWGGARTPPHSNHDFGPLGCGVAACVGLHGSTVFSRRRPHLAPCGHGRPQPRRACPGS